MQSVLLYKTLFTLQNFAHIEAHLDLVAGFIEILGVLRSISKGQVCYFQLIVLSKYQKNKVKCPSIVNGVKNHMFFA